MFDSEQPLWLSLPFVLLLVACGHRPQPERPVLRAKCDTLPGVCTGVDAIAIPDPWERGGSVSARGNPDVTISLRSDTLPYPDSESSAERLAVELDRLEAGIPLAEWRATHPTEPVVRYSASAYSYAGPLPFQEQTWCARATFEAALLDGRTWRRHADFYPPKPSATLELPPTGAADIERDCALGRIVIEVDDPDPESGEALARSLARLLDMRHGRGIQDPDLHGYRAFHWTERRAWGNDSAGIAVAYSPHGAESRLLAVAYLPIACETVRSSLVGEDRCPDGDVYYRESDRYAVQPVRRIAEIAELDPDLTDRLLGWLREATGVFEGFRDNDDVSYSVRATVSALEEWFAAADELEGRRRAAALFVADRVLRGPGMFAGLSRYGSYDEERARLEALGATFVKACCSPDYGYLNDWLIEAWRLEPQGPVGDQAFLLLLEQGADALGCDEPLDQSGLRAGEEAFQCVIPAGERALERPLDPSMRAMIHRLLGDAYRDIVSLADGAGFGYGNANEYKTEAPAARRKAIEHYRQGLEGAALDPVTWLQWREAWRLTAGLAPLYTRFFYVSD